MIADTSFIIDLLEKNEKAIQKAKMMEKENRGYALGAPTLYELWVGVARTESEQKEEILDIISSQIIHSLDEDSGLKAGKIQRNLLREGDRIGHIDALLAGITAETSGKILTGNTEEFDRIEEIETQNY